MPEMAKSPELEGVPEVDLRTLLGAMAALKTEVRASTETARATQRVAEESTSELLAQVEQLSAARAEAQQAALAAQRGAALALIKVADGLAEALELPLPRRGWRRRPDPTLVAHHQGLALLHRGVLQQLAELGVHPIDTSGPFDPKLMEAVRATRRDDLPPGEVLEVVETGWRRGDAPLRLAQVVVSRPSNTSLTDQTNPGESK